MFSKNNEILGERFLCGVCRGYLTIPPIFYSLTQKVHICGRCYDAKLYRDDAVQRAQELEDFFSNELFPCSNYQCPEEVTFGHQAKIHERNCKYAEIKCPISNFFRGYLKPAEVPCFFRCKDEQVMINHISDSHTDYILPAPHMIRSSDVLLDSETRRMYILIFFDEDVHKLAVLTIRKKSRILEIRCRTLIESQEYCIIETNPPISDKIQCFVCTPWEKPRYQSEDSDEVYKMKLYTLKNPIITIGFIIEKAETAFMGEDEEVLVDAIKSLTLTDSKDQKKKINSLDSKDQKMKINSLDYKDQKKKINSLDMNYYF